jgi:hypothetical protein
LSRYEGLREKAEHACMASMLTPGIAERKSFKSREAWQMPAENKRLKS